MRAWIGKFFEKNKVGEAYLGPKNSFLSIDRRYNTTVKQVLKSQETLKFSKFSLG